MQRKQNKNLESNNRIQKKNISTIVIIAVVLCLSVFFSILKMIMFENKTDIRKMRLLCSKQKVEYEHGNYKKGKYPVYLLDREGKILLDDERFSREIKEKISMGNIVDIPYDLAENNRFVFFQTGIIRNNKLEAVAYFQIPKKDLMKKTLKEKISIIYISLFFGGIFIIVILVVQVIYWRKNIFKPMEKITNSVEAIIAGNYTIEVTNAGKSDIGGDEMSRLTYAYELMRDEIYDKQVREEELKKSQQELISCISHDLKTPISTIKAYSEGIRDKIAATPKEQEEYIQVIIKKTDLLNEMIKELLEYSNTQLNKLSINKKEIYFVEYYSNIMKEIEAYIIQNNGSVQWNIEVEECIVNIDTRRITEVLYNLVQNSIKYHSDEKLKMEFNVKIQDGNLQIKVIDNGIGINAADVPFIFDKFYRAEKSRNSTIPGSGLGLSICKYIMEEHDGAIECRERKNGSEIVLMIPVV